MKSDPARSAPRYRIEVPHEPRARWRGKPARTIPVETVAWGRAGVVIDAPIPVAPGRPLWLIVEESGPAHRRLRRWRGTVTEVTGTDRGFHLCVAFSPDEAEPVVTFQMRWKRGRIASFRYDPVWASPPSTTVAEPAAAPSRNAGPPPAEPSRPRPRIFPWVGLAVLLTDQAAKAFGSPAGVGRPFGLAPMRALSLGMMGGGEHPAAGPAALVLLLLAGLLLRWTQAARARWRWGEAVGWGLVAGGLASNLADLVLLGAVRTTPRLLLALGSTWNPADLLLRVGLLFLAATWAWPRRPELRGAGVGA